VLGAGPSDAERIAICRAVIEALNDRNLETYFSFVQPDYAIRTDPAWDGGAVLAERAALTRFLEQTFAHWDELRYEFAEGPEVIGDRVLTRDRWSGRRSGEAEWTNVAGYWAVASFRGELVARVDTFASREAALEFARIG
jgi:hypothetical protein